MMFTKRPRRTFAGFDMTPMIDVVLQLIIFFMYTSQFAQLARTPVEMPEEAGDDVERLARETITIDLVATGEILLEGDPIDLAELERVVRLEIDRAGGDASKVGLLIRADQSLPALHVNRIGNRLAELGLRGWKLGTRVPLGAG